MPSADWERIKDLSVDELGHEGDVPPISNKANLVDVAFQRIQTKALQAAADAQVGAAAGASAAALAAKDTAEYTKQSAFWMKWSVIALVGTSVLNVLVTWFHHGT